MKRLLPLSKISASFGFWERFQAFFAQLLPFLVPLFGFFCGVIVVISRKEESSAAFLLGCVRLLFAGENGGVGFLDTLFWMTFSVLLPLCLLYLLGTSHAGGIFPYFVVYFYAAVVGILFTHLMVCFGSTGRWMLFVIFLLPDSFALVLLSKMAFCSAKLSKFIYRLFYAEGEKPLLELKLHFRRFCVAGGILLLFCLVKSGLLCHFYHNGLG